MFNFTNDRAVVAVLMLVVVSSGCVQSGQTQLKSDFGLDYEETSLNSSGEELYQKSFKDVGNISNYHVSASNEMAMNLPVAMSFYIDMNTTGAFQSESSEFNSTGDFRFNLGDNSNSTEFQTSVVTSEGGTEISRSIRDRENTTEFAKYSREALGLSLTSLNSVETDEVNVLGLSDVEGEENVLLEVDFDSKDLMSHTNRVLETHALMQVPPDADQQVEQPTEFNSMKAYLWTERDGPPSKLAYYGTAENGTMQIRSTVKFTEVEN